MDYSVLEKSTLFKGIPAKELRELLAMVPHHIQCYDKGETILHLMDDATKIGIILEGRVEAQKPFPNGVQVNVSIRFPGELIGPAAVFSTVKKYPCDVVSLDASTIMIINKEDILKLMQKDIRILENFTNEISTATYMLQQRIEMFSYSGIAQKAAYYLLTQKMTTNKNIINIPESMTKWSMLLNVSRPSLYRELKKLENDGIIKCNSHSIEIINSDSLEDVLSQNK